MADDAWGDLFAKAADVETPDVTNDGLETSRENQSDEEERQGGKTSKSRKRRRGPNSKQNSKAPRKESTKGQHDRDSFENLLEGRMDLLSQGSWPSWIVLGAPLDPTSSCPTWKSASSTDYTHCTNCGRSAMYHSTKADSQSWNSKTSWPLQSLISIRNIRCWAILKAGTDVDLGDSTLLLDQSDALSALKPLLWKQLPQEEARILESKLSDLLRYSTLLAKTPKMKPSIRFRTAVRLVVACDAMYYRTYYLQLTRHLPMIRQNGETCLVPHPLQYFGWNCFTMDAQATTPAAKNWISSMPEELDATLESQWLSHLTCGPNECGHPLAAIHKLRWLETISLFSSKAWQTHARNKKLVVECLKRNDEEHETPAPELMMAWRDSCRDFLCNLYAYATLPQSVLQKLTRVLKDSGLDTVEVGAGTGYIARLLQEAGISVTALDIHPTETDNGSTNEYHGNTPPFCKVGRASQFPRSQAKGSALLLCYPPPESQMARDTLQAYLNAGGTCLIHIGEFKGLTGDTSFERLLTQKMHCQERYPCLNWGTDASHVTVWVKEEKGRSLLLPCSQCQSQEATKRCRLLRSLVYCSQACFDQSTTNRKNQLRLQMIELPEASLEFTNSRHFSSLA